MRGGDALQPQHVNIDQRADGEECHGYYSIASSDIAKMSFGALHLQKGGDRSGCVEVIRKRLR